MKRFKIDYTDDSDSGCPVFSSYVRGYDREHALERFFNSWDGEGWRIIKVTPARK